MFSSFSEFIYWIIVAVPSILVASTIHEYSHGYTAFKLGDPTAKAQGRLTLNPIKHIDPIGAISMILFRFGWSKPVPINEYNFEKRELYTAITAFAGPLSNFIMASIVAVINHLIVKDSQSLIAFLLLTFATINLALGIFNLLPIPPLDGHKIVRAILPKNLRYYWEQLEKYSLFLIIILVLPISPFSKYVSTCIFSTLNSLLLLLGF